jgi:hypothetical protein
MNPTIYNNPNINFNSTRTKKVSVRLPKWRRTIIEYCAEELQSSITDIVSRAIESYFLLKEIPNREETTQEAKDKMVQMDLFKWERERE